MTHCDWRLEGGSVGQPGRSHEEARRPLFLSEGSDGHGFMGLIALPHREREDILQCLIHFYFLEHIIHLFLGSGLAVPIHTLSQRQEKMNVLLLV